MPPRPAPEPSLRERLDAKSRRTLAVPVQVTDPSEDIGLLEAAQAELDAARVRGADVSELADRAHAVAEASRAVAAHYATVRFTALPRADFDALIAANTTGDGDVDRDALAPVMFAECADDPSLSDPHWWRDLLARFSSGEWLALYSAVFAMNGSRPPAFIPKG